MATVRSNGYVVTNSVWNAVLSRLTDDGVTFSGNFSGGTIVGSTGAFSGAFAATGAASFGSTLSVAGLTALNGAANVSANASAIAVSMIGRAADNISILRGLNNAANTSYAEMWITSTPAIQLYTNGSLRATVSDTGLAVTGLATATAQPAFSVFNGSNDTHTGVTTVDPVDFDSENYDNASNFSADTFTAPVAGQYRFNACVSIVNNTAGARTFTLMTTPTNPTYLDRQELAAGETATLSGSCEMALQASDTVRCRIEASSSADFVVYGNDSFTQRTTFSGRLLV